MCKNVQKKNCWPVAIKKNRYVKKRLCQKCKTERERVYTKKPRQECKLVPKQDCATVYVDECIQEPAQSCNTVYVQDCTTEKKCSVEYKEECTEKPSYKPSYISQDCKSVPVEKCWDEQKCVNEPREECKQVYKNKCNKVPKEKCNQRKELQCKKFYVDVPSVKTHSQCVWPPKKPDRFCKRISAKDILLAHDDEFKNEVEYIAEEVDDKVDFVEIFPPDYNGNPNDTTNAVVPTRQPAVTTTSLPIKEYIKQKEQDEKELTELEGRIKSVGMIGHRTPLQQTQKLKIRKKLKKEKNELKFLDEEFAVNKSIAAKELFPTVPNTDIVLEEVTAPPLTTSTTRLPPYYPPTARGLSTLSADQSADFATTGFLPDSLVNIFNRGDFLEYDAGQTDYRQRSGVGYADNYQSYKTGFNYGQQDYRARQKTGYKAQNNIFEKSPDKTVETTKSNSDAIAKKEYQTRPNTGYSPQTNSAKLLKNTDYRSRENPRFTTQTSSGNLFESEDYKARENPGFASQISAGNIFGSQDYKTRDNPGFTTQISSGNIFGNQGYKARENPGFTAQISSGNNNIFKKEDYKTRENTGFTTQISSGNLYENQNTIDYQSEANGYLEDRQDSFYNDYSSNFRSNNQQSPSLTPYQRPFTVFGESNRRNGEESYNNQYYDPDSNYFDPASFEEHSLHNWNWGNKL